MKNEPFGRGKFIMIVFMIMAITIVGRMVVIQNSAAAVTIGEIGEANSYELRKILPERGSIYDRWGHMLAGNTEVYEVNVDTRYVRNADTIASTAASMLDLDYDKVYFSITGTEENPPNTTVFLKSYVSAETISTLAERKNQYDENYKDASSPSLRGLIWSPYLIRSYPEKTLASNILGFYSFRDMEKGRGYFGVEEKYNDLLSGTAQTVLVPRDPYEVENLPDIPPGASLILTIDREIQAMAERVADKAMEETGSESATILISDPKTGEILAMANTPRMDLNKYWEAGNIFVDSTPFNRAIGETYEPGSVFKVLTMASAIDAGVVTPTTPFLDTGVINVGGVNFTNWDGGAWGPQDMTGCMRHSLNVCLSWVAVQMGPTKFYEYMNRFGIGHRTNVDLGGEVLWPLSIPGDENWYLPNLATNSFGQGLAVTPMQMIMAVSAVANDGKMMAPHVLRAVIDDGRQHNNTPQVVGTPISAETARQVTEMLATSLEQEASSALVPGYRVAGKTGTAEIPTPYGYTSEATNASFVGWGPVSDPRFVVYIWLEKPQSDIWGSVVAAPVFSEVVQNLVVLMNLPPDEIRQELAAGQ